MNFFKKQLNISFFKKSMSLFWAVCLILTAFGASTVFADTEATSTQMTDLESQKLKNDPGAFPVYRNDGFTLAEILVERVSGISFSDFIVQNIAAPLGMKKT